jgi:transcriptional regulator with XRE-family HTH domain
MTTSDITQLAGAIARTVKLLRAERGWSLDQLCARSGVSKGVLVALEQGRSNPNLATLAKLSDAFGVPLTLLVDVGGEPAVRIGDVSRVMWHGPAGGIGTLVGATDPPWGAELWRWEVLPGESFGGDAHAPGTRELIWVESGCLTVTVDGEPHQAEAGESARFPAHLPHHYGNSGDEPARFIMLVVVPPAKD